MNSAGTLCCRSVWFRIGASLLAAACLVAVGCTIAFGPRTKVRVVVVPGFPQIAALTNLNVRLQAPLEKDWPFVVDYRLEEDGELIVEILEKEKNSRSCAASATTQPLRFEGEAAERQQRVLDRLPLERDKGLSQHCILVSAVDPLGDPVKFALFGLGAGKKSVASVAIQQLRFGPPQLSIDTGESSQLSFRSKSDFTAATARVFKKYREGDKLLSRPVRTLTLECIPTRGRTCRDWWDSRDNDGQPSLGVHELQILAAIGHKQAKDWVLAISEDLVEVIP